MPRWACRRDANEPLIFSALLLAGRDPIRLRDIDIIATHVQGYGVMIEVKVQKGRKREIQIELARLFPGRYFFATTPEAALAACGVAT